MGDENEIDGWADIHRDILKEIAKRFYSYDDFIQLGLVCKQWNLKLAEISKEILWLLLPEESSSTHVYEDEEIYHLMQLPVAEEVPLEIINKSLEENRIHHMRLPEMQNTLIRGSYHGWIVILDIYQGSIYMLNVFTRLRVDLPPVTVDSCPSSDNQDFMAVVIYGSGCNLAYYKPSNKRWLEFPIRKPSFHDVIFFGDKIYAIEERGQLYEFDTTTKSGPVGGIHEAKPPSDVEVGSYQLKYLVGCANGSLLMLVRCFCSRRPIRTSKFDIYELNKNTKEWSKIDNLKNSVLMIGLNSSVRMLPTSIQSKGSQIYFTDNYIELKPINEAAPQDIGIFNLYDRKRQRLLSRVKFICPPVWCYSS
ncbi:hypothetical protein PIB30_067597 [Stylosanthes scabra]|uniref:KIB1-4 beta-propeller domain-containing protein n=1 Tax=Stylosanthes scabra TaxID=79078 RepID=A0ABU6ULF3_9FABA|nr:hypothetical protein [Stylosanthes scabra]